MKAFTDILQSKRLAEILPIESADMCYRIVAYNPNDTHEYQPYCFSSMLESDIPCWSLAALLEYLRKLDLFPEIKDGGDYILMDITFYDENEVMGKVINPVHFIRAEGKNILDACYEFILKLNEQKLL